MNSLKKYHPFKEEQLNLVCEWGTCKENFTHLNVFHHHINAHIKELDKEESKCKWRECGIVINSKELIRHHYFHAFHTRLKCHGDNLIVVKDLPRCTYDCLTRNCIPSLPEDLCCFWENCGDIFESSEAFYRHVSLHADSYGGTEESKSKKIECLWQGCEKFFPETHKLKEHLRMHTQEKLLACPICGGMFSSRTSFLDHIMRQVKSQDVYPCGYCNKKMSTERLLKDHMRHHINHYKCPNCDMTCPNPSTLQNHIIYRHSEDRPFKCTECDYSCKVEGDLKKHQAQRHNKEGGYVCPIYQCNYKCRSHKAFSRHFHIEHEGGSSASYMCHLCDKTYTRGNYLTQHLTKGHKFRWPAGHCRFRYHKDDDGIFRLQTVRYESLELTESLLEGASHSKDKEMEQDEENKDDPEEAFQPEKRIRFEDEMSSPNVLLEINSDNSKTIIRDDGTSINIPLKCQQ